MSSKVIISMARSCRLKAKKAPKRFRQLGDCVSGLPVQPARIVMALNTPQDNDGIGAGNFMIWRWQDELEATSVCLTWTSIVNFNDHKSFRQRCLLKSLNTALMCAPRQCQGLFFANRTRCFLFAPTQERSTHWACRTFH